MKLVVGLFALMLAIGAVALWIWRRSPPEAPCQTRSIAEASSPDGTVAADVFEVRCGSFSSTHVALRPRGGPVEARSDVFIAAGAVTPRVEWNGSREVTVDTEAEHVLVEETRWRNVAVRVRRVR